MTSFATCRDGIEAALNTVTGVGKVYDFWRLTKDSAGFKSLASTTIGGVVQIRVWFIRFVLAEALEESAFGEGAWRYTYEVTGYRSVNDAAATENEFMELVENVMRALANKMTFGASEARVYSTSVAGMTADHAMISDTFCHRARISVTVEIDSPLVWS